MRFVVNGHIASLGFFFCLLLSFALQGCTACGNSDENVRYRPTREDFIKYNRRLFWCDSVCIAKYSDSLGLNTQSSPTNLWLTVHNQGAGEQIANGDHVTLDYSVMTLLGDTLYTSAEDGKLNIVVGKANVCIGLDEALLNLRHDGSVATAIIIPEKAFGFRGDDRKIHGRVILRYDIKVLN